MPINNVIGVLYGCLTAQRTPSFTHKPQIIQSALHSESTRHELSPRWTSFLVIVLGCSQDMNREYPNGIEDVTTEITPALKIKHNKG